MTAEQSPLFLPSPRASSCKMPPSSFLARPCSTSRVSPGASAESVYSKVQHFEGETLSVQCSYKSRKNHVGGKVWCKIRKKKCETGFTRVWAQGPRYLLQDDAQAKVVNITMVDLRRQDSGRYWCMRNSSGILYPLMGFQLEVSPAPTTKRNNPLTQLANILKSGIAVTMGQAPTSGPGAPFTTSVTMFTPGVLTLARLLPSAASGTIRLTSLTGYGFTSPSSPEPRRTTGLQTVTASPSNTRASSAGPATIFTTAGHLPTRSPTTSMCHTSRSPLDKLPPIRNQDSYPIVLLGVLTFLSVPVMLIVVYGFWKKRHMGSYSVCRGPARHRKDPLDGRSLHGSQLGLKPCMEWGSFSQRGPRRPEEE
ncbi:PREDICTED: trem-like transcript 2 protein isoform X1 [Hipposideros armiger]|uniref:Trem-like transcript 2 protein n=1 Tax=Hipposideros armiger TaxID=186990 RepID=A0A8B7SZV0_HIPAR|nr:PREDICTED: trem-like transcript 2 protein isoform X1 [Hipposideros armiger]XP_019518922.1 PREDICTED: trem-like transcript 2 protein isoform X1 [Hipposideros armiger]